MTKLDIARGKGLQWADTELTRKIPWDYRLGGSLFTVFASSDEDVQEKAQEDAANGDL